MKKMTKILSLALALALVLGMTAFAGTPSKLVLKDDFSDASDLSFETFGQTRTNIASYATDASPVFSTAIDSASPRTYKKYYAQGTNEYAAAALTNVNGQIRFGDAALQTTRPNRNQLVYSVADGFTFERSQTEKVALVADIGFTPRSWYGSGVVGAYGAGPNLVMPFYKQLVDEDADTEGIQNTSGTLAEKSINRVGTYAADPTNGFRFLRGTYDAPTVAWGSDNRITFVARPGSMYGHNNIDKSASGGYLFDGLNMYALVNRGIDYISKFGSATNGDSASGTVAHEIQAIGFSTVAKAQSEYYDFRMMELSLDPADFYIDRERTIATDKDITKPVRVYFSQPLAEKYRKASGVGLADTNYVDIITVTDAEGNTLESSATIGMEEVDMGEYTAVLGYVDVTVEDMDYGADYTVTFPKQWRTLAMIGFDNKTVEERSITFTTQPAPSFNIALTATEGLAAGGETVAADAMAGKTVYFKADATNTSGRDVNGVIVIGIYDAEGNLVKYAAASDKDFATAGSNSFSAAFKLAAGQTAKAYVKGTASEVVYQ